MSLSPAQLDQRLAGITGTDLAAVVGVHPQRSAVNVWLEKRGEAPPWVDTDRTIWGEKLEPLVRVDYAARHGLRIEEPGTLVHPDHDWMMATPDGVAYALGGTEPLKGLEIKTHTIHLLHLYGAPGTDEVPPHELCQCVWGMAVTGLERWDLVAFIDNQPREYVIERDDEVIAHLKERAERFLVDNVRGGVAPDPDGSDAYDEWLKARWSKNTDDLIDIGDDLETFALIERGRELREHDAEVEAELQRLTQAIKTKIGDKAGVTWRDANGKPLKLTWKRSNGAKRVDHAAMAKDAWQQARLTISGLRGEVASLSAALKGGTTNEKKAALLIEAMAKALTEIGERGETSYTTTAPGNRPFTWPRQWKARPERNTKERPWIRETK
jgi:putative phage-type endonuclease